MYLIYSGSAIQAVVQQFCLLEFRYVSSGCVCARFARYEQFGAVLVAKLSFQLVCFCNCIVGVHVVFN